jgi:hypothetical protein
VAPRNSRYRNANKYPATPVLIHPELPPRQVAGSFARAKDVDPLPGLKIVWFSDPKLPYFQKLYFAAQQSIRRYLAGHTLCSVSKVRADSNRPHSADAHSDDPFAKTNDAMTTFEVDFDPRLGIDEDLFSLMKKHP